MLGIYVVTKAIVSFSNPVILMLLLEVLWLSWWHFLQVLLGNGNLLGILWALADVVSVELGLIQSLLYFKFKQDRVVLFTVDNALSSKDSLHSDSAAGSSTLCLIPYLWLKISIFVPSFNLQELWTIPKASSPEAIFSKTQVDGWLHSSSRILIRLNCLAFLLNFSHPLNVRLLAYSFCQSLN